MSLTLPKNKKVWIFLAIAGLAVFLFAFISKASASITYSRTPSGANLIWGDSTTFYLAGNKIELNGGESSCAYLEVWAGGKWQSPQYAIADGFAENITAGTLPLGDYRYIKLHRTKADGYTDCIADSYLEGNGTTIIFSVIQSSQPTPIPESVIFQIFSDTETYITENPYPFSYSYRPLERFTPATDTQVCSLDTKIQYVPHGEGFIAGENMIVSLFSGGLATPSFANTLFWQLGGYPVASLSYVGEPIYYTHFDFGGCYNLTAGTNYWFLMGNTGGAPHEIRHYGRASNQNYTRSSAARYSGASDKWVALPNFDLSLRLLNFNYQTPAPTPPPPSPPSTASYGFEDKDFGLLGNMFRDVIVWLFFPDQANLERFGNLWDTIRLKPPIGYFTAAKDELALVGVGTANIAFDTTAAAGIITPLRTGIIVILWVLFAFWIFHRLRNLDL
jgi:hypothetical protein